MFILQKKLQEKPAHVVKTISLVVTILGLLILEHIGSNIFTQGVIAQRKCIAC